MASPLDITNNPKIPLFLPKKIDMAINLIQAFMTQNNNLGLKIAIILIGVKDKITYNQDNQVIFNINELCELCKIDRTYLKNNLPRIIKTQLSYVDLSENKGRTTPIHSYEYRNNNNDLMIEVSSKAKQLFNELKKKDIEGGYQFTQAITKNLMNLNLRTISKHTLKMQLLLEMINNYGYIKRKYFCLEELNGYFGTNYKRYGELDRKILRRVKQDIDISSSFSFVYQPKTEQAKIIGVYIDIVDNQNLFTM